MIEAERPEHEDERLATLHALELLDTAPSAQFDRITRLAKRVFDVPVVLVSLVDEDRQWFKSADGTALAETPRSVSFCAHAVASERRLVIEDASKDERFADNPLVTDIPGIRFYAGEPIFAPNGMALGTLCLIDTEPRSSDEFDLDALTDFADLVEREIESHAAATTDSLTGLVNRRGLLAAASRWFSHAQRSGEHMAAVVIDVDGLKQVNDELGHAEGDALLRLAARTMRQVFRTSDVVARIGGDEFAIAMLNTSPADVDVVRARLAQAVAATHVPGRSWQLSLSSGGASTGEEDLDVADFGALLQVADERMYAERAHRRSA